jgi:glycosyltransferase involved in cell wall biosynthesis
MFLIPESIVKALNVKHLLLGLRSKIFPPAALTMPVKVCVVVPAFPVMGGVLTVLEGMTRSMQNVWDIEYLTQFLGPDSKGYTIHQFGSRHMTSLYFPFAWFYVFVGFLKFLSLMRRGAGYQLLLPQDGVFSAALAGLAAKVTGVRTICIDHSDISLFTPRNSRIYREERIAAIATKTWPKIVRLGARSLLAFYWPSRFIAARIAARFVEHYLIPGVPGDSIEEGCQILGIPSERVTRYASTIDIDRHVIPDEDRRRLLREHKGLPADCIIITIASRLSAEKGLEIALESIDRALASLPLMQQERVRVVIAGEGPQREQLKQDVQQRGLDETCLFWGEQTPDEIISLLSISDIFLYTSTRGACMAMAVLEAMASGCAVIASTEPLSNAVLLDDGRGIAVSAGNVEQTNAALLRLLSNMDTCRQMGRLAREYIRLYHTPAQFRHLLLETTGLRDQQKSLLTDVHMMVTIESESR